MNKICKWLCRVSGVPGAGLVLVGTALAQQAPAPTVLPTGGKVVAGQASIGTPAGNTLTIQQGSARAAIDWSRFDIGAQARVNVLQPSANSVLLNRVLTPEPSQIFGSLTANGQVFLSNPAGVYFAPGASVDVGGLVATTHAITTADFMAGKALFSRNGATGSVVNEGSLTANPGGYIALLAPEVRNGGVVTARLGGTAALAAGERFTLQFDASGNALSNIEVEAATIKTLVENRHAVLAPDGLIILSARAASELRGGVVNTSGRLDASSMVAKGGRILITGDEITLAAGSQTFASGAIGGGTVLVGGDWQGSGSLHQATAVTMAQGASIDASATQTGNGGKVVLWSGLDKPDSLTRVQGSISARGGAAGGNGGQIETSGHGLDTDLARVDASAPLGKGGQWLLDPTDITVNQAAANAYQTALNNGTDVTAATSGKITWNSGVTLSKTGGTGATLTLTTGGNTNGQDISLDGATISASSGALNLVLWTRSDDETYSGAVSITGSTISTNGGHLWIGGGPQAATLWNGLTVGSTGTATWMPDVAGIYLRNSSINTGAGNIFMSGRSHETVTAPAAPVGTRNYGLHLDTGTSITTTSGAIDLRGDLKGAFVTGVAALIGTSPAAPHAGNVSITSGSGAIGLTGTGSSTAGGGYRHGLMLAAEAASDQTTLRSGSGAITLSGTAAFSADATDTSGLQLQSSTAGAVIKVVSSTGSITLSGENSQEASQFENAIRLSALNAANSIRIGYDGTTAYSGNILIEGNSLLQRLENAGSGSIAVQSTGGLTIAPKGTSFTALRAADSGSLIFSDDWNFGSTLGSFTLGKAGNTADLALGSLAANPAPAVNSPLSVAGPISLYGGDIAIHSTLTSSATGDITIQSNSASNESIVTSQQIRKTGGARSTLTLRADGRVKLGGGISASGSTALDTVLWSDFKNTGSGGVSIISAISTNGGHLWAGGSSSNGGSSKWNGLTVGDGPSVGASGFNFNGLDLAAAISTGGGDVMLWAGTGFPDVQFPGVNGLGLTASASINSGSGKIVLIADEIAGGSNKLTLTSTGHLTLAPDGGSYAGAISFNGTTSIDGNFSSSASSSGWSDALVINGIANLGGLSLGKYTGTGLSGDTVYAINNSSAVTLGGALAVGGPVSLYGGNLAVNAALAATSSTVTLNSSGAVTQTAAITGDRLVVVTSGGNATLTNATNNVATLSASGVGNLSYVDSDALSIGGSSPAGIQATGLVDVRTLTGNLTVAANVTTTSTAASPAPAITLNAGANAAAGAAAGGNIIISGTPTLSTGANGRVILYSGSVNGSAGLTTLLTSGSGRFRYNSDETTKNYTTALGSGSYAVYRERPSVSVTVDNKSITYGDAQPSFTATSNAVNGDAVSLALSGPTFSGASKLKADSYTIAADLASLTALGYNASGSNGTLQVDSKPLSLSAADKVYDGSTAATMDKTAAQAAVFSGDTVTVGYGAASFDTKNVGSNKAVTVSGPSLTGADAGNYSLVTTGYTARITAKPLTLNGFDAANKIYDGSTTAVISNAGTLSGVVGTEVVTVASTGASFDSKNVGTGKTVTLKGLTLAGADAGNYSIAATVTDTADITAKPLTLTGFSAADKAYDGNLTASISSTGTLSGLVGTETVTLAHSGASFDTKNVGTDKTVTLKGVAISGAGSGNYSIATTATDTADITPRPLTLSGFSAADKVYDGNTTAAITNAGTLGGVVGSEAVTLSHGDASFDTRNAGSGKTVTLNGLALAGADAGNYSIPTSVTDTADITAKPLTLTGFSASSKAYDGGTAAAIASAGTLDGVIGNDAVTLARGSASFDNKNVGTGKTVTLDGLTLTGADAANYSISTHLSSTADITAKPLTLNGFSAADKVYDGNATASIGSVGALGGIVDSEAVTLSHGDASFDSKNVGSARTVTLAGLALTGADAGNYSIAATATDSADITARPLTLTGFRVASKVYDGGVAATIANAGTLGGVVGSEAVTLSHGDASFDTRHVGTGKTVTLNGLALAGADAANYSIPAATTLADITARPLTISGFSAASKVYDGTAVATIVSSGTLAGLVGSDEVSLSSTGASFDSRNVGTAKTVTLSAGALTGADAGNYSLAATATGTADITARPLALEGFAVAGKVYDGTRAASLTGAPALAGVVSGDAVTLAHGNAAFDDKNAGLDKTVTLAGVALGGADAGNYSIAPSASAFADISPRVLTVSYTAASKVYDASTAATLSLRDDRIGGDALNILHAAAFQDANAGQAKPVLVSGVRLAGADAGNYSVARSGSSSADITKRPLELTVSTGLSKTYDGTSNLPAGASGYGALGGVLGSDAVQLGGEARFDSAAAGARELRQGTVALSGAQAGNYSLVWKNGSGSIQKAPLTVRANDDARFVTESDAAGYAGVSFIGLVHGETAATAGLSGALSLQRSNAGVNAEGHYAGVLHAAGLDAANYAISYAPGDYSIVGERQLLLRVGDVASVYGSPVNYGVSSARYLSASTGSIVEVTGSISMSGNAVLISGIEGGSARFDLVAGGALSSSGGQVQVGSYQVDAVQVQVAGGMLRDVVTVTGTHSVAQKPVTADAAGASKVYDGSTAVTGVSLGLSGLVSSDVVTVTGSGAFASRNAGSGIGYTISSLDLSGADARNYFLVGGTSVSGSDGTITPRLLSLNFDGVNKVYDGNTTAAVIARDNRIAGDSLSVQQQDASFADKNVGSGKPVAVRGITLSGVDAGNYSLASNTGSASASITRLDTAVWTGGNSGSWFDPANWQGGAVPDLSNVGTVVIPQGVLVDFNSGGAVVAPAQAGPVHLDGLGGNGGLAMNGGELNFGSGGVQLDVLNQSGGSVNSTGSIALNTFKQTGGSTSSQGDLSVRQDFSQTGAGAIAVGGGAQITDTQGGTVIGQLSVNGGLSVNSSGGAISQTEGGVLTVKGESRFNASEGGTPAEVKLSPTGNRFDGTLSINGVSAAEPVPEPPPVAPIPPVPPAPVPAPLPSGNPTPPLVPPPDAGAGGLLVSADPAGGSSDAAVGVRPSSQGVEVSTLRNGTSVEFNAISVTLPQGSSTSGSGFSFALPQEVFAGAPADAPVDARLLDGGPLPGWLRYDPGTRSFVADAVPDRAFPIQILVKINGREIVVTVSERTDESR